jgi:hypothetical protein
VSLRDFQDFEFYVATPSLWSVTEKEARRLLDEAKDRWGFTEGLYNAVSSYETAASSLAPVSAAAYANIWAPTRPLEITHTEFWQTTVTALPQVQLLRTTARGTQTTTVTPTAASNSMNPGFMLAPTFVVDTAWSVQPTQSAVPMRMPDVAGVVGSSLFWDWGDQDPLQVVNGNGIVFWNASGGTTGIVRVQVRARE